MTKKIEVIQADLHNKKHAEAVLILLNDYATDIMGGGNNLSEYVRQNLVSELIKRPTALVLLAYEDELPVGLAIAFEGFSTFYAKPLLNIHDLMVRKESRGKGIAKLILEAIEELAIKRGYCKLTLEVLEGNKRAQKIYTDFGFDSYVLDEEMGKALFWDKKLY